MKRIILVVFVFLSFCNVYADKRFKNDSISSVGVVADDSVSVTIAVIDSLSFYRSEVENKGKCIDSLNRIIKENELSLKTESGKVSDLEEEIKRAKKMLSDSIELLDHIRTLFASKVYYELFLYAPLDYEYRAEDIAVRLELVKILNLEIVHSEYNYYVDVLAHYDEYLREIADWLSDMEESDVYNVEFDKVFEWERRLNRLERTMYWKKCSKNPIPYIERRIDKVKELFKGNQRINPASFGILRKELLRGLSD